MEEPQDYSQSSVGILPSPTKEETKCLVMNVNWHSVMSQLKKNDRKILHMENEWRNEAKNANWNLAYPSYDGKKQWIALGRHREDGDTFILEEDETYPLA